VTCVKFFFVRLFNKIVYLDLAPFSGKVENHCVKRLSQSHAFKRQTESQWKSTGVHYHKRTDCTKAIASFEKIFSGRQKTATGSVSGISTKPFSTYSFKHRSRLKLRRKVTSGSLPSSFWRVICCAMRSKSCQWNGHPPRFTAKTITSSVRIFLQRNVNRKSR